ncbi:hypothetical protein D9M68_810760 [compost metagenome]
MKQSLPAQGQEAVPARFQPLPEPATSRQWGSPMIAIGLSPEAQPGYPPGFFMPTVFSLVASWDGAGGVPPGLMGIASLHHILRPPY